MKTILLAAFFASAQLALASPNHEHPKPKIAPQFEAMKALVGKWEGTTPMGHEGGPEKTSVTYELTSNGTALIEKLAPGTPMEMVSMYATRGGKDVTMTHYCSIGNQPEMKLKSAKDGVYTFEMEGNKGITDPKEMHMHAVTLTLNGDHLKQEWTNFNNGKKDQTAIFEFTRKK